MSLSAAAREEVSQEMAATPHGGRGQAARRLAKRYGVSVSSIYRFAKRGGARRSRSPAKPEYREWTRILILAATAAPGRNIPLDVAREAAIESGALPPEAANMPIQTAYRIAREMGLDERRQRTHRLSADYPMQALQIDGSSSEHLVVVRELEDGDWLLRLHRRPFAASGYKNKPLGPDRMRVLLYAVWDMCTGCSSSRYCVARGESAWDAMEFLCWAMSEKEDPRQVIHGVPDCLWSDQGPMFKSRAARDLLERLDIELVLGAPYQKTRMGGVERTHRTRWQRFEAPLFLRGSSEITLSALNERVMEFDARENESRWSRSRVRGRRLTRAQAFRSLMYERPADRPLRELPENPMETMAQEARRKVDINGLLSWSAIEYEVPGICDRWVIARRHLTDPDCITVEDERTGERWVARPHQPLPYGEIRTGAVPLREQLRRQEDERPVADIYRPSNTPLRIIPMPDPTAPAAPLENPLDASCYRDAEEARRAFMDLYPYPLPADLQRMVNHEIEEADYDRTAVRDLAMELLTSRRSIS